MLGQVVQVESMDLGESELSAGGNVELVDYSVVLGGYL